MQIANRKLSIAEADSDNLQFAIVILHFAISAVRAQTRDVRKKRGPAPAVREPGSVGCFENRPTYTSARRHSTQKQVVVA
jgi:hypothetical protein